MLKTKVYASGITNLTDARYFAAWYIDWMGFDLSAVSAGQINLNDLMAIKEWIDGPKFVAEFTGLEPVDEINKVLSYLEIDCVKVEPFCSRDQMKKINADFIFKEMNFGPEIKIHDLLELIKRDKDFVNKVIIKADSLCQLQYLEEVAKTGSYYFDVALNKSNIENGILDIPMAEGFVFKGGEEEKTGVKDYEAMDEVFELIASFE